MRQRCRGCWWPNTWKDGDKFETSGEMPRESTTSATAPPTASWRPCLKGEVPQPWGGSLEAGERQGLNVWRRAGTGREGGPKYILLCWQTKLEILCYEYYLGNHHTDVVRYRSFLLYYGHHHYSYRMDVNGSSRVCWESFLSVVHYYSSSSNTSHSIPYRNAIGIWLIMLNVSLRYITWSHSRTGCTLRHCRGLGGGGAQHSSYDVLICPSIFSSRTMLFTLILIVLAVGNFGKVLTMAYGNTKSSRVLALLLSGRERKHK